MAELYCSVKTMRNKNATFQAALYSSLWGRELASHHRSVTSSNLQGSGRPASPVQMQRKVEGWQGGQLATCPALSRPVRPIRAGGGTHQKLRGYAWPPRSRVFREKAAESTWACSQVVAARWSQGSISAGVGMSSNGLLARCKLRAGAARCALNHRASPSTQQVAHVHNEVVLHRWERRHAQPSLRLHHSEQPAGCRVSHG